MSKRLPTLMALLFIAGLNVAFAEDQRFPFDSADQEARFDHLTEELRCLVCQNQSLADSDAPLANDLRDQVYDMVKEGQTDEDIIEYLVARYGEFVLYRPRLNAATAILWAAPAILFLIGLVVIIVLLKRKPASVETDEMKLSRLRDALAQAENEPNTNKTIPNAAREQGGPSS